MSGSQSVALGPDAGAVSQVLGAWATAIAKVTTSAEQSLAISLYTGPQPRAVTQLGLGLTAFQGVARSWVNDLRPVLVRSIPADLQSYGELFVERAHGILELLHDGRNDAQLHALTRLFAVLQNDLALRVNRIAAHYAAVTDLLTKFKNCFTDITAAKGPALLAVQLDEGHLEELITEYHAICGACHVTGDLEGFLSSDQQPLILATVENSAIKSAVAAVFKWIRGRERDDAMRHRIRRAESLRGAMTAEQRRVAAMRLGLDNIGRLLASADEVASASAAIFKFWKTLEAKQIAVFSGIEKGRSESGVALSRVHVQAAQLSWSQLAAYAGTLMVK